MAALLAGAHLTVSSPATGEPLAVRRIEWADGSVFRVDGGRFDSVREELAAIESLWRQAIARATQAEMCLAAAQRHLASLHDAFGDAVLSVAQRPLRITEVADGSGR